MSYEEWRCVKCHRVRKLGDPSLRDTLTAKYLSGPCIGCKRAVRMFERVPAVVWSPEGLKDEAGQPVETGPVDSSAGQGERLKEQGMRAALNGASHGVDVEWTRRALAVADRLIIQRREFTSEDITNEAGLPSHRNATGALVNGLARKGRITRIGYRKGTRASQHSRAIAVWRAQ